MYTLCRGLLVLTPQHLMNQIIHYPRTTLPPPAIPSIPTIPTTATTSTPPQMATAICQEPTWGMALWNAAAKPFAKPVAKPVAVAETAETAETAGTANTVVASTKPVEELIEVQQSKRLQTLNIRKCPGTAPERP